MTGENQGPSPQEPAQERPHWLVRTWPLARSVLQIALLAPEMPQGLCLVTQALVVIGDAAAAALAKGNRC